MSISNIPRKLLHRLSGFFLPLLLLNSCSEILSPDISMQSILVNSPSDSLFTSNSTINFWWEKDNQVEQYEFRITYLDNGNLILHSDSTSLNNTIAIDFNQGGVYSWQVRGINEGSETNWVQQTLFIDQTAPDRATALSFDGDTLYTGTIDSLAWMSSDFPIDGISYAVRDSLILYRKNDSTTVADKISFPEGMTRKYGFSAYSPSPMNGPGTYYWRVVSIDRAGNRQESEQFQFVVQ